MGWRKRRCGPGNMTWGMSSGARTAWGTPLGACGPTRGRFAGIGSGGGPTLFPVVSKWQKYYKNYSEFTSVLGNGLKMKSTDLTDCSSYLTLLHPFSGSPELFAHRLAVEWRREKVRGMEKRTENFSKMAIGSSDYRSFMCESWQMLPAKILCLDASHDHSLAK